MKVGGRAVCGSTDSKTTACSSLLGMNDHMLERKRWGERGLGLGLGNDLSWTQIWVVNPQHVRPTHEASRDLHLY